MLSLSMLILVLVLVLLLLLLNLRLLVPWRRRAVQQVPYVRERGPVLLVSSALGIAARGDERRNGRMVVMMGRKLMRRRLRGHRRQFPWCGRRGRASRRLEGGGDDRASLVGELLRPGPGVRAFEETALVAELKRRVVSGTSWVVPGTCRGSPLCLE